MSRRLMQLLLLGFFVLCPQVLLADTFKVRFHVVDASGQPVVNAELSSNWVIDPDRNLELKGYADAKGITDADGMAELSFEDFGRETVVMGFSEDRSFAGITVIDRQKEGATVEIKFDKTSRVTATFKSSEDNSIPTWTNMIVTVEGNSSYFFEYRCSDGQVSFPFPAGEWKYKIYGTRIEPKRADFKTVAGEELAIGELDFELDTMAKLIGKPAPNLDIAEARGIEGEFDWANYRGKWVLLNFWGFW